MEDPKINGQYSKVGLPVGVSYAEIHCLLQEREGIMEGQAGRVLGNTYKGHKDKTKGGKDQGCRVGMAEVRESGGWKMETTVFEQ